MISLSNQGLITKSGGGVRGDATVYEQDGSILDIPGFQ
jgi:hypothetical protein